MAFKVAWSLVAIDNFLRFIFRNNWPNILQKFIGNYTRKSFVLSHGSGNPFCNTSTDDVMNVVEFVNPTWRSIKPKRAAQSFMDFSRLFSNVRTMNLHFLIFHLFEPLMGLTINFSQVCPA